MYCAYITTLKEIRSHSNADRLKVAVVFGNNVIVDLNYYVGQRVIYFPTDGQLSEEFANDNNLVRKKDAEGNNIGGYLDPNKRNICALKLRGEKSDGLVLPIEVLSKYTDVSKLSDGDKITILNGHEICKKYIPARQNRQGQRVNGNKTRKKRENIAPLFAEHVDTEQLAYNLGAFRVGDQIEITLKIHGTSQRTGYLPCLTGYDDSFSCKVGNAFRKVIAYLRMEDNYEIKHDGQPKYDTYDYISGTRRVVLDGWEDGGFYGSNMFRKQHADRFQGKLLKGETVYYEVCGFTDNGTPIMGNVQNSKIQDKEFTKQYGKVTTFSYGCDPTGETAPKSDFYVYRMTMTNEDGDVVEYPPDYMRYRCEQMGVKTVPVMWRGIIPNEPHIYPKFNELCADCIVPPGEYIKSMAELFYDGPDPIGKSHVREGVVVRIVNMPKFTAYKHKNWSFKALEGIVKDTADAPDMEEAQEVDVIESA